MSIIISIIVLSVIVIIHEFGHFIVAKKGGILVEEFAVGMGPTIASKQIGETLYSLRALPIGGFCRMMGEDTTGEIAERSFSEKNVWIRMAVVFAGPFMNFVLAMLLVICIVSTTAVITPEITSLSEGYPAQQAGLKSGDIIRKVDDKDYTVEDFDTIASEIKGKEGTKVKLVIERDGEEKSFEIERKSVELIRVTSQMLEDNIGYIYMSTFDGNVAEQIRKEYKDLKSKGATSLIIDIRNNGGGLVEEAVEIGDMLTDKGTTLLIQKDNKDKEKTYTSEKAKEIDMNFVLLTNNYSASASEILSAIVKEKVSNGKVVGMTTYGKGVIQTLYTLADGSGLKLTTDEYFTPNHETINKKGITPDYVVEGTFDSKELDVNNDKQLQKAIEVLKNDLK